MNLEGKFNMLDSEKQPRQNKESSDNEKEYGRVMITGGTEGIGREIAEEFIKHNNAVAICARTKDKIEGMKESHKYSIPELIAEQIDLSDRHDAKKFAKEAIDDLGGLDALILNAASFDFRFKSSDLSEGDIRKKMFQTNEVANVALTRESREALRKSKGVIVFMTTRFGIVENIETASAVDSKSTSAQEDIGNYIKNKKRIGEYFDEFIQDEANQGIFVFSVIPGTVNTPANKKLIEVGTAEMSDAKIKERKTGKEKDPRIIGRIIAKMTATRKKFNPETRQYDENIVNGEIVEISNAAVEFEKELRNMVRKFNRDDIALNHVIVAGDMPYGRPPTDSHERAILESSFRAREFLKYFPSEHMEGWPQDQTIISTNRDSLIERVKLFYGQDISNLTFRQMTQAAKSIESDFEIDEDLIIMTQDELLLRSRTGSGTEPVVVR